MSQNILSWKARVAQNASSRIPLTRLFKPRLLPRPHAANCTTGSPSMVLRHWVSIPVVDMCRLGFKFGPKADILKSPFFSMPWGSDIRQKKWRQRQKKWRQRHNDRWNGGKWHKDGLRLESDRDKCKYNFYCSETLTGTCSSKYVKQWILKFKLGT